MNRYSISASASPIVGSSDLTASYDAFFKPREHALTGEQPFPAFEIYSTVNYSIPVTVSGGSLAVCDVQNAALE